MRKYAKPEVRFMETELSERISANCWGSSSSTTDSVIITYSNGSSGSATVSEGSLVPWVNCVGTSLTVPLEVRQKLVDILKPTNPWVTLSYIGGNQFDSNSTDEPILLRFTFGFSGSSGS